MHIRFRNSIHMVILTISINGVTGSIIDTLPALIPTMLAFHSVPVSILIVQYLDLIEMKDWCPVRHGNPYAVNSLSGKFATIINKSPRKENIRSPV